MAPIKFEEQIKKKLEQRSIQPSTDAWEQLSNSLHAKEKRNSKRLFFYIGIAASVVGVLLMSNIIFNTKGQQNSIPTVVDVEVENKTPQYHSTTKEQTAPNTHVATQSFKTEATMDVKKEESVTRSSIETKQNLAVISTATVKNDVDGKQEVKTQQNINSTLEESMAMVSKTEETVSKDMVKPASVLSFEDLKTKQVVTEIKKLQEDKGQVSDSEIEDLLKEAEKEILQQRIFNETARTVNAEALLQDVEEELETSFRTKVFESLKSSYKTVKTAVAERNN